MLSRPFCARIRLLIAKWFARLVTIGTLRLVKRYSPFNVAHAHCYRPISVDVGHDVVFAVRSCL
jgi:hypothetical protein